MGWLLHLVMGAAMGKGGEQTKRGWVWESDRALDG